MKGQQTIGFFLFFLFSFLFFLFSPSGTIMKYLFPFRLFGFFLFVFFFFVFFFFILPFCFLRSRLPSPHEGFLQRRTTLARGRNPVPLGLCPSSSLARTFKRDNNDKTENDSSNIRCISGTSLCSHTVFSVSTSFLSLSLSLSFSFSLSFSLFV